MATNYNTRSLVVAPGQDPTDLIEQARDLVMSAVEILSQYAAAGKTSEDQRALWGAFYLAENAEKLLVEASELGQLTAVRVTASGAGHD